MARSKHRKKKTGETKRIRWSSDKDFFMTVPANPQPTLEFQRPETNSRMEFTLLRGYPTNHPQSLIPKTLRGSQSVYKVTYIFSVPGSNTFRDKINLETFPNSGTSLLQTLPNEHLKIELENEGSKLEILFLSNKDNLLSHAQLRVQCESFEEAERFAHERICTILSYWSFLYDVALEIAGCEIVEENTGSLKYALGFVGKVKAFTSDIGFHLLPEYRRLFAAYREAMNATNIFFQAICFYKVVEGVISLRTKEQRKNGTFVKGIKPFESDEKFPDDFNLLPIEDIITSEAFKEYVGKNFKEVIETLKNRVRNATAHLTDFDDVLDADRFDDIKICSRAIPVLKYLARQMIQTNLNKLSSFNKKFDEI